MANTPTTLWRAVAKQDFPEPVDQSTEPWTAAAGVLYPDFEVRQLPKGRTRNPDVVVLDGVVQTGGGTSLFNKQVFKGWCRYFEIPEGTDIPQPLVLTGPSYNRTFDADHYQIECKIPMSVGGMKGALDNMARNAVELAYRRARGMR